MIKADTQLMWSSDYPHWDFDLPGVIYDLPFLDEKAKRNILGGKRRACVRSRHQGGEENSVACNQGDFAMPVSAAKSLRPLTLLLFLVAFGGPVAALDYPTRPIRFIISFAAGGPNDTIGRILGRVPVGATLASKSSSKTVSAPAAMVGMADVLPSAPDGYTIGFCSAEQRHQRHIVRAHFL